MTVKDTINEPDEFLARYEDKLGDFSKFDTSKFKTSFNDDNTWTWREPDTFKRAPYSGGGPLDHTSISPLGPLMPVIDQEKEALKRMVRELTDQVMRLEEELKEEKLRVSDSELSDSKAELEKLLK